MEYYILSLTWTNPSDVLFTFFRSAGRGYTFAKKYIGTYNSGESESVSQHFIGDDNSKFIVPTEVADALMVPIMYEGVVSMGLPITPETLSVLGIRKSMLLQEHPTDFAGVEFLYQNQN